MKVKAIAALLLSIFLLQSFLPAAAGDHIVQHYEWEFEESKFSTVRWSWDLNISLARLERYKGFPAHKRRVYGRMITTKDETIIEASEEFRNASDKRGYDADTEVSFVLSFIQSLEYTSDKITTGFDEYPRFPLETLADRGGDCEDTSVLFATLIILLGYDAVLFIIREENADVGHMAVGVSLDNGEGHYVDHEGKKYYYAETTGENWKIGDLPKEYSNAEIRVQEFTGEQYDPDRDNDGEHFLEKWLIENPALGLVLLLLIAVIVFLFIQIVRNAFRSDGAEKAESGEGGSFPGTGIEGWQGVPSYSSEVKRGPLFLCPNCSSALVYNEIYGKWWCGECGEFPFRRPREEAAE